MGRELAADRGMASKHAGLYQLIAACCTLPDSSQDRPAGFSAAERDATALLQVHIAKPLFMQPLRQSCAHRLASTSCDAIHMPSKVLKQSPPSLLLIALVAPAGQLRKLCVGVLSWSKLLVAEMSWKVNLSSLFLPVQDVGRIQKYSILYQLLADRSPATVLGAICALAVLVQPEVATP